jgi:hypothetical protein
MKLESAISSASNAIAECVVAAKSPHAGAADDAAANAHNASAALAPSSAAGTLTTVGDVCKEHNQWLLTLGLRKWAQLCSPDGRNTSVDALDATPVALLLPHLKKYMVFAAQATAQWNETARIVAPQAVVVLRWVRECKDSQGLLPAQAGETKASATACLVGCLPTVLWLLVLLVTKAVQMLVLGWRLLLLPPMLLMLWVHGLL